MLKKVLIANRGEIAIRVIRACRDLGIATVAVFSEADRKSLHVRYADEAYLIGPAPARDSYLRIDRIINAAKKSGADAVHPGYGFLSERAEFAEACVEAGLVFIGPPAAAIRNMGDKVMAKQLARAAGVPLVPGTDAEAKTAAEAKSISDEIGYPVLIKAAAGGGGKGMRVVRSSDEIESAFGAATREAANSFGYGGVYIEKLLENVKHVEIQIIADSFGNAIHLGERECSMQRRHQKMLEEAPSMALDDDLRRRMGEVAVAAAKKANYVNAGTIEFLVTNDKKFYFMEMNTRLQVEHPVTELITGVDIVTEQLKIASGLPLSYKQEDIVLKGWAIECRITAEDPFNNFLPSIGIIERNVSPNGPGIRLDSAVFDGYEVSLYYDPMISKLITYGNDRLQAIERMQRALREYRLYGIKTTIPFHQQLLASEAFQSGEFYTTSLETNATLKPNQQYRPIEPVLAAIAGALIEETVQNEERQGKGVAHSIVNGNVEKSGWKEVARREVLRRG
ncbi:MAG: acetyl-CoA carboxylase biotin carboxylase subunit [Chloroflexi bacterium]|uniref:biotin carboxylase n=1 Tax=Candidatus Chlorohelix allophototropha TaxID=3003348 RepID=A0A8T7LYR4_9CHLR|nr:acetyl-CoA carboxylase biotin carboxylase subunit [Chloroflexota bacterium]WJW66403.1 acetyl-CoA carboxylase biotin carboxylase subunit [Chloroflexota bacterium L227-S17]